MGTLFRVKIVLLRQIKQRVFGVQHFTPPVIWRFVSLVALHVKGTRKLICFAHCSTSATLSLASSSSRPRLQAENKGLSLKGKSCSDWSTERTICSACSINTNQLGSFSRWDLSSCPKMGNLSVSLDKCLLFTVFTQWLCTRWVFRQLASLSYRPEQVVTLWEWFVSLRKPTRRVRIRTSLLRLKSLSFNSLNTKLRS